MRFDRLSNRVIGCALEVHRHLGPGLLESTYEQCLAHELKMEGIPFKLQFPYLCNTRGSSLTAAIVLTCWWMIALLLN